MVLFCSELASLGVECYSHSVGEFFAPERCENDVANWPVAIWPVANWQGILTGDVQVQLDVK